MVQAVVLRHTGGPEVLVLRSHTESEAELRQSAEAVFPRGFDGTLRVEINQRCALAEIQRAHTDLEGRATRGATVLMP